MVLLMTRHKTIINPTSYENISWVSSCEIIFTKLCLNRHTKIFLTNDLFSDFKAAYDSFDRFSGKLTKLIRVTMDSVLNQVNISGGDSSLFEARRSLRQVDQIT